MIGSVALHRQRMGDELPGDNVYQRAHHLIHPSAPAAGWWPPRQLRITAEHHQPTWRSCRTRAVSRRFFSTIPDGATRKQAEPQLTRSGRASGRRRSSRAPRCNPSHSSSAPSAGGCQVETRDTTMHSSIAIAPMQRAIWTHLQRVAHQHWRASQPADRSSAIGCCPEARRQSRRAPPRRVGSWSRHRARRPRPAAGRAPQLGPLQSDSCDSRVRAPSRASAAATRSLPRLTRLRDTNHERCIHTRQVRTW